MKLNQKFILREVAGEYMLVNSDAQRVDLTSVFSLNESAAWLWRRIGTLEFTEDDLVTWLLDEYEVEEDVARGDVRDMVALWHQFGMIEN